MQLFLMTFLSHQILKSSYMVIYRTRAIISHGLYIFYRISKDHFFVFKKIFSENSVLMYGLYSKAASNQERLMMAPWQNLVEPFKFRLKYCLRNTLSKKD